MATKKPEYLKISADGSYIDVTLRRAYDLAGTKTSSVRMREPTVADQLAASEMTGSDARREIQTMSNLCGLAPDEIMTLSSPDYARLQAAYTNFFD
jgi:phage FluMu protein gp41